MMNQKRVMFVFGTRPEAIKMAPVINALRRYPDILQPVVIVTGQHRQMLDQVLKLFNITPDYDLEIMQENQSLASILTRALTGLEGVILQEKPDMLLVQGDTSTAFAAALSAYYHKIPLGHVEAGLRTFDKWRPFPEEINRKMITSLADLHFAPTQTSVTNLESEKVARSAIVLSGNSVIDALLEVAKNEYAIEKHGIKLDPKKKMVLVTAHRRESFGKPLADICRALARLAKENLEKAQFVIPVHRNPNVKTVIEAELSSFPNIILIEPQDYEPFVHIMKAAHIILTDSGGIQEEAPSLGKPVLVMREKTERPEAVLSGTVKLVGTDPERIYSEATRLLVDPGAYAKMSRSINPYGDGQASKRIVSAILYYFGAVDHKPEEFKALVEAA